MYLYKRLSSAFWSKFSDLLKTVTTSFERFFLLMMLKIESSPEKSLVCTSIIKNILSASLINLSMLF